MCVYVCERKCVCVWRERESERATERERERECLCERERGREGERGRECVPARQDPLQVVLHHLAQDEGVGFRGYRVDGVYVVYMV